MAGSNPHSPKAPSTPLTGCAPPTSHPQHVEKTYRSLPISLLARAAAARPCACVRHSMSVWACVFGSAYTCRAAVRHKRVQRKAMTEKEADSTHANYSYHYTHTAREMSALNHNTSKRIKNKTKRGTTSAHTLIAPVKQITHTQGGRERSPTQCNGNKTKTVTVLRPCSQAGRRWCVWCKREHQRACMGVHAYIQWAHYVCASWGEVRARVHARGHTQRVSERRVCVRAVHGSLSLTLTRTPPQQRPHTQQEEKAKEGRWCGRPWCCCRCRQALSYHSFEL
ncbi:hypothetical protein ECC02_010516 [Trypanosoma cruzi]|uniref:Uncharacterized protein n=1 Tax=Trypanosoma cruzi TaxID=5693 RepID=A0A7J6XQ94_TRYCR|nr:hypothetical protein ECC02_010516 [Trypanosoma cruzi]